MIRKGVVVSHANLLANVRAMWMPRLADFAHAHPEVALNLSAAHTHSDFALGQADIDIRYGVPQWSDVEIEPLFTERILPLASPALIRQHRLKRPEHLMDVPLIQSTVSVVQWADWFAKYVDRRAPERFGVRFDRAQMSLDAASQGLGVALESYTVAGRHLAEGKLRPIFGIEKAVKVQGHFLVYPARHAARPPVAAFLKWIRKQAAAERR